MKRASARLPSISRALLKSHVQLVQADVSGFYIPHFPKSSEDVSQTYVAKNNPPHIDPEEVYYGSFKDEKPPIQLRIATGGAGQSGLIRAFADKFIDDHVKETGCKPFAVAWIKSDTAGSFNNLAQGSADLSITYHPAAEEIAKQQGFTDRRPTINPAKLDPSPTTSIFDLFGQLFRGAVANPADVRFLSRYDKSATNVKEAFIWTTIGQTPWAYPYSDYYHRYNSFPFQALAVAAKLGEYTLVDRGTWYGVDKWIRDSMTVYMEQHDSDTDQTLLNPAHALVGTWGKYRDMANAFADWMIRDDGGQKIASEFTVNGAVLYTRAPKEERKTKEVGLPFLSFDSPDEAGMPFLGPSVAR
ncbi:MAG: hypothetical protein Q9213_008199 [Squamulea squamosa]